MNSNWKHHRNCVVYKDGSRGGNRSGQPTWAYGPAYNRPRPDQNYLNIDKTKAFL